MNKPSFKRMFYRYTLQDLPLYVAEIFKFYRYTLQDLPLYVAGFTVIRCRISQGKFIRESL